MKLPEPLNWLSLVGSIALASAPAVMAVTTALDGSYGLAAVYLAIAAVVFAVPEYIERQLPGPKEFLRRHRPRPLAAVKRRLLPGTRDEDE